MENKDFPAVPLELLEALEKRFPERSPKKGECMEDMMWRGGQRSVVTLLKTISETQNTTVLNTKGSTRVQI